MAIENAWVYLSFALYFSELALVLYISMASKKYNLNQSDISQKGDLEKLREKVKEYRKKYNKEDKEMEVSSESDSEVDEEEQRRIDEEMRKRQQKKKGMRASVSAEVYDMHNVKKPYVPRVIPKTSDQIERIKDKCMQSFIFISLEDKELKTVIDSFEEKNIKPGKMLSLKVKKVMCFI